MLLSPMLRCKWWRFAPWQLAHLDVTNPERFVAGVFEMRDEPEFNPSVIDLKDYG
jgi:hypothetical protein